MVKLVIGKSSIDCITPDKKAECGDKAYKQIRQIPAILDHVPYNGKERNPFTDVVKVLGAVFSLFPVHAGETPMFRLSLFFIVTHNKPKIKRSQR